jgi:crossover junction endodeoxyribonuclease RusA
MTQHAVSFTVAGAAVPKGSMKAFGFKRGDGSVGAFVTSDNRNLKGWETNVRSAAQQQCQGQFFDGAVRLAVVFFLPRPQSLPKKVKHHVKKPDLDKLARAVKDALKGVLWQDDSQVVDLVARKAYATTQPHARIVVDCAEALEEVAIEQNLFEVLEEVRL